jgi:cytochrome bd-type quinol oxidase subunit 1
MIAALGFLVFSKEHLEPLTELQRNSYYMCMFFLLLGALSAISGWVSQAMYYTAWAVDIQEEGTAKKDKKERWRKGRNIFFAGFAISFLIGVISAIVFVSSFLKYK